MITKDIKIVDSLGHDIDSLLYQPRTATPEISSLHVISCPCTEAPQQAQRQEFSNTLELAKERVRGHYHGLRRPWGHHPLENPMDAFS